MGAHLGGDAEAAPQLLTQEECPLRNPGDRLAEKGPAPSSSVEASPRR